MDFKDFLQLDEAGYGRNKGYAHGFASPHAPSLGSRHREDDEYHVPDKKPADHPHAVHINGKKWKSFGSQSHAQNVANKIRGATVHKEEMELTEDHMVHVSDGSKYGDKPNKKDTDHVMAGLKKHGGSYDGASDKGAYFKFKSHNDAHAFKKHVDSCPGKSCYADLHEAIDKEHPIAKEYHAMKQNDIKTLRNMIKGQQKIVDTSGYTSKDHAISAYLRHKHGDKNVAKAMGLKEEDEVVDKKKLNGELAKKDPVFKDGLNISEESDHEDDDKIEKELDAMIDKIDELDDIIDAYEDDELIIVDADTGEEVEEDKKDIKEEALNEVLSRAERMRAKIRFAKSSSKRQRRLKIALKSRSSSTTINSRARKLAIKMMKQKMAKKPLNTLSIGEKERIEKVIQRRKAVINRMAMKLAPKIKKIEQQRLSRR